MADELVGMSPDAVDGTTVPRLRPTVSWVLVDGEAVVVIESDGRFVHLNPSATLVLECCDGTGSIAELVADLAPAVGVPEPELLEQVVGVVRRFGELGMLVGVAASRPVTDLDSFDRRMAEGLADGTIIARPIDYDHENPGDPASCDDEDVT